MGGHPRKGRNAQPQERAIQRTPERKPDPVEHLQNANHQLPVSEATRGRYLFLLSLREGVPHFWQSLRYAVQQSNNDPDAARKWAASAHVIDDWLVQAAVDTVNYWAAHPESPNTKFEPGYQWFRSSEAEELNIPEFAPVFENASPQLLAPAGFADRTFDIPRSQWPILWQQSGCSFESIDAFATRITAQFVCQLKEYKKRLRNAIDPDARPELKKHSQWAVCRFAGVPLKEVVEHWPGARRYEDPTETIVRQVNRFASVVGLHLPLWGWTRKP